MMAIKQKGFTEPVLAEEKKVWETKIPRGGRMWLRLVYPNEGAINTFGRQKVVKATPFLPAWGKLADFKHFIKTLKGNALNRGAILIAGSRCGLWQDLTSFDLHFKKAQGQVQAPDKQTWFHGAEGAKLYWQDSAATWSSAWPSPGVCSSWLPLALYLHLRELPWLERANSKLSKQSLVPPILMY